jgi:lysophospholipase L1-like esterase
MADTSQPTGTAARLGGQPSRWANLLKNLGLAMASALVCLAVIEGVLRLLGYGHVEIYEPDPILFWKLKPNQDCWTKIGRKPVHINSQGTRGAEFQAPKPPGTIRILSLGDSRTFGWGLTEAETYSGLLERRLREAFPGRRFEVVNAGVNAWSYPQMQAFFSLRVPVWQPDFVILAEANLWTQFSDQADPRFTRKLMNRVRLKNFLRRFALYHYVVEVKLKDVYERYRTRFIPVDPRQDKLFQEQQQHDPDAFFRKYIVALCQSALTHRVTPILIHIPELAAPPGGAAEGVAAAKAAVARQLGVPFLDLAPALKPGGKALYLEDDPVHLNTAGNEIVARRLFDEMSRLLSR